MSPSYGWAHIQSTLTCDEGRGRGKSTYRKLIVIVIAEPTGSLPYLGELVLDRDLIIDQ